jgi:hypothetical protein
MRGVIIGLVLACGAEPAIAQGRWVGWTRVSASAGLQPDVAGLSETIDVVDYLEPTSITTDQAGARVPFVDAGLAIGVIGNLGVSVAVSNLSTRDDIPVAAGIPHPFHFDRPRPITGLAFGVRRAEVGVHTDLVYLAAVSDRIEIMFQGGATFFQVKQDLVSDVTFSEAYPFDTARFSRASTVQVTASKVGYNTGVDISWRMSRRWGIGGLVRYSRARVPFELDGVTAATVDIGGLQAAGGVRFAF